MVASRDGGAGHVGWAAPARTATRGVLPAWRFHQLFRGAKQVHGKNFCYWFDIAVFLTLLVSFMFLRFYLETGSGCSQRDRPTITTAAAAAATERALKDQ
jgi:hypothetical protein